MRCARCGKWLEDGREIKFAREGDWMGKPLCKKCRAEVEEESREKYRRGRAREYPGSPYEIDVYTSRSD